MTGYLWWAANAYGGLDPYKTSLIPVGTSDASSFAAGDGWFFYPGPDGLRPGLRMVAFREGLVDHALLTMLAQTDRKAAQAIRTRILRSPIDYETSPSAYRAARRALLEALDLRNH